MEWAAAIDGYCERTDPSYWAEPVNALSNAAFLIAAFVMWQRVRGTQLPLARGLVAILAGIGVCSYLFHTHAQVWAGLADSLSIAVFALVFVFAANRHFWGLRFWPALGATALLVPFVAVTVPIFARLPFFAISAMYWPLPVLMLIYAQGLRRRAPATARGLGVAAALCALSLTFRSLDETLCGAFPLGTHFIWHLLNGILLGWLIEIYLRHMRGPLAAALRHR